MWEISGQGGGGLFWFQPHKGNDMGEPFEYRNIS